MKYRKIADLQKLEGNPRTIKDNKPNLLDKIINLLIKYLEQTQALTVCLAQGGDFIGGNNSNLIRKGIKPSRKAMNSFICSVDRPIKFMGRLNEDITTYVNLGSKGGLFLTIPLMSVEQLETQKEKGGLTEVYRDTGTYTKSFFSVMYNPSSVKISKMGVVNPRIHHKINWENAVPQILNEELKKYDTTSHI